MFTEKSIRIKNHETEEEYRLSKFKSDKKVILLINIIITLTIISMITIEAVTQHNLFQRAQIARIVYTPISIFLMWLIKKEKTPHGLDLISIIWLLCLFIFASTITFAQIPDNLSIMMRAIIITLITYTFINIPLEAQLIFGSTTAFFNVSAIFIAQDYTLVSFVTLQTAVSLLITNIIGYSISYNRKTLSRKEYTHLIREKRKKVLLAKAFREIKTLRGILPICSFCHKIRDDAGYWKQLDGYISTHSYAVFSHGICPKCAEEHYPNHYNKDDELPDGTDKAKE